MISDNSDGLGWFPETDDRNQERRKKNQVIWKIMNLEDEGKKE